MKRRTCLGSGVEPHSCSKPRRESGEKNTPIQGWAVAAGTPLSDRSPPPSCKSHSRSRCRECWFTHQETYHVIALHVTCHFQKLGHDSKLTCLTATNQYIDSPQNWVSTQLHNVASRRDEKENLTLHFTHGRLSNTIRGVLSNWAYTQKPTQQMGLPTKSQF